MEIAQSHGFIPNDTTITTGNPVFLDVTKPPFRLYGLCEPFRRVPDAVAKATSEAVASLAPMTAGARIRFATDSDYIVIHAEVENFLKNPQDSTLTTIGFDLYQKKDDGYHFLGLMAPSQGEGKSYVESRVRLQPGMKDLIINFPLFAAFRSVSVALREGSELDFGSMYRYQKPVVFYGSSIVHGVGAGRPSSNYPSVISRRLDSNFINLGFSGAARAETAIMDYISGLDMSVFVYDYDHNAPDADYLQKTHYEGYRRFRAAQPNTPVIMASKVDYHSDPQANEVRRKIVMESYRRGLDTGDRNLYFVDGSKIYPSDFRDEFTADCCHPNDAGYLAMAYAIGKAVKQALNSLPAPTNSIT